MTATGTYSVRMRVEYAMLAQSRAYVLARREEKKGFRITDSSTLGGVPIEKWLTMPRKLNPDGAPDFETFGFALKRADDRARFQVGDVVLLEAIEDDTSEEKPA